MGGELVHEVAGGCIVWKCTVMPTGHKKRIELGSSHYIFRYIPLPWRGVRHRRLACFNSPPPAEEHLPQAGGIVFPESTSNAGCP